MSADTNTALENQDKPKRQSKTLIKILKNAHNLLWQRGYAGMSLNDLVAKAKISKGGFFHYFPNKKSVVEITLKNYFDQEIIERFDKHLANKNDAISIKSGLFNWLEETYNIYNEREFKQGCMLGNMALEVSDQDDELRDDIKSYFITWENKIVSIMKPVYQTENLLMEPRQFARLFIATFQGITMTCKAHQDANRASRDFQALGEFIERIIKG